jgi:hypothetical protein
MRILFDNGTPEPLIPYLAGHGVTTAIAAGWERLENGDLLSAAERAGFEVLLTTDKNIRYQQFTELPRLERVWRDKLVVDMTTKKELLKTPIQHIDIKQHNVVALVDAMAHMAYSSRDLARAASIYEMMLRDTECGVILCLAGSLISAGLQKVIVDLVRNNMVDAIVSTGANIVDQDFFEALGYRHYIAGDEYKYGGGDADLRELMIDRIYDTFIDEEELRHVR